MVLLANNPRYPELTFHLKCALTMNYQPAEYITYINEHLCKYQS